MPKNVMKISKPSPNLARNDFDLSHRLVNSINFGELLPTLCLETVPDDYFEISASNLLRAIPMVTSPFLRAKQHIELWFVPYTDLWHNFNQFITERKDPLSAALKGYSYCPHVNLEDLLNAMYTIDTGGARDIIGRSYLTGADKIFNLLGYGDRARIYAQIDGTKKFSDINLWRVLAYNKIWYDEYRNKYYDDGTNILGPSSSYNPSLLFNVDNLDCSTYANAGYTAAAVCEDIVAPMFQMRYRQWKKDLFTGVLPSTQFGVVSSVSANISGSVLNFGRADGVNFSSTNNVQTFATGSSTSPIFDGNPNNDSALVYKSGLASSFDVLALRKSEAIQKWRQISLLSGNSVYDNMRGHYGVTPDHDRNHRPTYIGSVDAPLNIGDINAQSQTGATGNQILGSVAGKALSSFGEKVFKFKANDFGIIMALSSILPEAEYNSFGLDRPNQLIESDDYFKPEYQNLGLEAVGSFDFDVEDLSALSAIGYAPRYYGYKQKIDKVTSKFQRTSGGTVGPFAQWVSPKYDILNSLGGTNPLAGLYVNPAIFDGNFVVGVTTSEEFMNDQYWKVKAVRAMSELGLPSF